MPTQILRNIMGRLLGLGPNHELVMAGSKILYGHGSNLDAQVDLVSAVQCLLQCAIPFISPSSGTMGNNGALSGITALRQTYPAAWFVVPANYIFAGSLAGTYFGICSSTTAAQLFATSPTIVGNQIPIPTNPTPFVSTGPGAVSQVTGANVAALVLSLPGASMRAHGTIRMKGLFTNNNSAGSKLGQMGFGSTTIAGASNTTNISQPVDHEIRNRGVQNSQVNEAGSGYVVTAGAPNEGAVDTSAAVNLVFFEQLAVATDTCQWDSIRIDLLRSP